MRAISLMLERTLSHILVVLMGVIVINVSWQVITRFIMNSPSSFTEELARFLLIWIGFLGGSYAYARRSHLSLDLLLQSVPEKHKPLLLQVSNVFCFAFAAAALIFGGAQLNQTSPALGVPVGYVYSCIPLSGALICWFALTDILYPVSETQNP